MVEVQPGRQKNRRGVGSSPSNFALKREKSDGVPAIITPIPTEESSERSSSGDDMETIQGQSPHQSDLKLAQQPWHFASSRDALSTLVPYFTGRMKVHNFTGYRRASTLKAAPTFSIHTN